MQRTNVVELKPTKAQEKVLKEMLVLSSAVFNMANYSFRQAIFKKKKVPRFYQQQKTIQDKSEYQKLGRSYGLPMLQKHSELVSSWFKLVKSKTQKKVSLPRYFKNRKTNTTLPSYLVMDSCQYSIKKYMVRIPLSRQLRKETGFKRLVIRYNGILKWKGRQKRGEIHYDMIRKRFYLCQTVKVRRKNLVKHKKTISIDLGVKRTVTTFDGKQSFIYPNTILPEWKHLTNLIGHFQSMAEKRNNRKTTKRVRRLYQRRRFLVDDFFKAIVCDVIRRTGPSKVLIGDVRGILENSNGNGKCANQMTHNHWSFGLLIKRFNNKCGERGIKVKEVPEDYTSTICPNCGRYNKPDDRRYRCRCGYRQDRDVLGAIGIFRKNEDIRAEIRPLVVEVRK